MKAVIPALIFVLTSGCVVVPSDSGSSKRKAGGGTVLLCHKGKKTMELPHEAAQGHLNHGDRYGPC